MWTIAALLALGGDPATDWPKLEAPYLRNLRQVTRGFLRPGQGYFSPDGTGLRRLTDAPGYNAEGSYSPDGKSIVFCSNRSGAKNLGLYIMDADGKNVRPLTKAPGCYNGGPFFSPDGKRVIFRSDRKKKDHLQLYVINSDGTGERALTDDLNWVYWAPYWYKDGKHIVYTAADHSNPTQRPNYDLYWMAIDRPNDQPAKTTRLTY